MTDGRFGAIRQGPDGLPQGGVLGTAHPTREQADAYVDALNNGATHDQAAVTAVRAKPPPPHSPPNAHHEPVAADYPPTGGWTAADRVTDLPARDTSTWRSVQTYPIGTELTVHAVGEDGPGRQLGHGTVVDHDGPDHVVVESPWGTRRTAPLSHVRPMRPTPVAPDEAQRWVTLLEQKHPSVTTDPHWPALAALLDRIDSAGGDVPDLVDQVLRDHALPDDHPARSLDYRLNDAAPQLTRTTAQRQPYTPQPVTPPPPQYAPRPGPTPPR